MADILRRASATWAGDLRSGSGTASTESGALRDVKMAFSSRFENESGSNPEELLAAAHAACFSMALSANLGRQGFTPTAIRTQATLTLHKGEAGFKITKIHLDTEAEVPGIDDATFQATAEKTKQTCPVSVLLLPGLEEATVSAKLRG
ncbi:MAG TPA: OsmC family peroxiredoxin [Roseiflexaceae bacterium]|nr:OsmC family peroxiredoxin [Roseiflexaceae bacterium]